jgi:ABC-type lipoprotein release transport system permease subunit
MLFSLSWRNIWRSKRRSLIMITAIMLGVCAGIFSAAFYQGMANQRIDKAIKTELAHIQIHDPQFRQANEINKYMPDGAVIADKIRHIDSRPGVSERIVLFSMISSAETGTGVKILGVDPDREKQVSNIHEKISEGSYFGEDVRYPILVGRKLLEKLKVKLGSKVVLTIQDIHNNITYGAFRVVGVYSTANNAFDESNVFVRYQDLAGLISMPEGACHEIAVLGEDLEQIPVLKEQIKTIAPQKEIMTWTELSPEMNYLTEAMDLFMYIFIIIILFALLFGIVNTMLMAVLERRKEIGMLMAVGMNQMRIFFMIILETVMLSLTGGLLGVGLGYGVSEYFSTHPVDLSLWAEVYLDMGYDPYVYTVIEWPLLVNNALLVFATGILAAIYPAIKALQNHPAEALRIE